MYRHPERTQRISVPAGGLASLRSLDISYNPISTIGPGVFEGLANLESLTVTLDGANQLGSLQQLANLKLLRLVGTSSIEKGDFDGLTNLERLFLDGNQISSIEPGTFDGLTNLDRLDLSVNQISSICFASAGTGILI